MNNLEKKMVAILKRLKDHFNTIYIKAEFEAEATRLDEAMRLKEIIDTAGLDLILKIGGAEAIRDMFDAQLLGVSGMVAPMIESSYALKKYLEAIEKFVPASLRKEILFGINIETVNCFKNLNQIFKTPGIKRLSTITVGRVDLSLSLGLSRDQINSEIVYEITEKVCNMAKSKGFITTVGGGIAIEAISFLEKLANHNLLDRFETRKVVFEVVSSFKKVPQGIILANEFELMWLENKKNYYNAIYREDDSRIRMLKKRLALGKKLTKSNENG